MTAEYLEFHMTQILRNAPSTEVNKAIAWVKGYVEIIKKEKTNGTSLDLAMDKP